MGYILVWSLEGSAPGRSGMVDASAMVQVNRWTLVKGSKTLQDEKRHIHVNLFGGKYLEERGSYIFEKIKHTDTF